MRWNGTPLTEFDADQLRRRIGVVCQEYYRWPFTAATNIALGDIPSTAVQTALEAAAVRAAPTT